VGRRTLSEACLRELGMRLKALREAQSETQKEVARIIGRSLREYQRYEKGQRQPSPAIIRRLARHYGLQLADLRKS
jgi:transcriptional regulator with XRE-family HTH domain